MTNASAVLKNVTFHGYLDPSWIRPAVGWHAGNPGAAEGANTLEYMAFGERRKRKGDDLLCHTSAAQSMPIDIPTWMEKSAVVVALPAVCLRASHHKTVHNSSADNRVPEPRRCMVFQDQDSVKTTASGYGLIKSTKPIIEPAHLNSTERVFEQLEGVA